MSSAICLSSCLSSLLSPLSSLTHSLHKSSAIFVFFPSPAVQDERFRPHTSRCECVCNEKNNCPGKLSLCPRFFVTFINLTFYSITMQGMLGNYRALIELIRSSLFLCLSLPLSLSLSLSHALIKQVYGYTCSRLSSWNLHSLPAQ